MLAVLLLASCDGTLYHSYRSVGGEWHRSDTIEFFPPFDGECPAPMGLFVGVRYSSSFSYRNLWLQVEKVADDSVVWRDTLCCAMFDNDGRRNGSTAGVLYQLESPAGVQNLLCDKPCIVRITHIMNDTLLRGVYDVGIRFASPGRHRCAGK